MARQNAKKAQARNDRRATVDRISPDAKIISVSRENPHRDGTTAAKTFELYRKGMTVGEWREQCDRKGGDAGYLHTDLAAGRVKVRG